MLIIGQAVLIHTGRRRAHRVIGRTSFVLAPLLVVSAVLLAHYRFAAMHETRFAAEAFTLYLPLYASVLFGACYGLAIAYRRHADAHARLMACTAVVLVDPVLARLLGFYLPPLQWPALYEVVTFAATDALLVTLMQSAPTASMARMLLRRVLALFVAAQLLWFTLARSAAWFAFAAWFRSLPLT